ncbi:hypothetical protein RHGRI_002776 [Rhododendron griersonianum]|uniref:Uncharacterized protein n=1 Tax=Rhododendron griersonianum TaxID=479676 RepID=A0AAV6LQ69_9ERIC|nr:hypothetical protein RHGRI_002776 [Rhododendron griersonianum]
MSLMLTTLTKKREVDSIIRDTIDKVLVLRFGRSSDPISLQLDDIISKSAREVSKFATVALVDIDSEEIQVYVKFFDITFIPSTVFFFNAHHMKMDSGSADHTKWVGAFHRKQDFIDVVEVTATNETTTYKRAKKKKTLAELKEEEILLVKGRRHLKRELATLRATVEKQRATNESLKRLKLNFESQPLVESVKAVAPIESSPGQTQQNVASGDPMPLILPPEVRIDDHEDTKQQPPTPKVSSELQPNQENKFASPEAFPSLIPKWKEEVIFFYPILEGSEGSPEILT